MDRKLPLAVVCRVLGGPRSMVYARRAHTDPLVRPGPATSISDHDLLRLLRQVLAASPFAGEATPRSGPGCAASTPGTSAGNGCSACCARRACWRPNAPGAAATPSP